MNDWFFKTTVNPNNPNVQQVRGQNIIANEIAGETIHPGGAEAYAMTKGLVSALPGVGMIMDLEALTDTNNSVSTRVMAGLSFGLGVMDSLSSAAAAEGRMCNLFCFTEGTQIVVGAEFTEDNVFVEYVTENIEDVEVGDLVYSYDTVTGVVSQKEVTGTFVRESDHINYLTIVDEDGEVQVIETTDEHPLWVVTESGGQWVEAKDLQEGDVFLGANGELSTLVTSERVEFPNGVKVYNFTVEGNHDYFVIAETDEYGQTSILVHNSCSVDRPSGMLRPHRHHIVMKSPHANWSELGRKAIEESHKLLNKYSIGIHNPRNLTWATNEGHTIDYAIKVNERLQEAAREAIEVGYSKSGIKNAIYKDLDDMAVGISREGLGGRW